MKSDSPPWWLLLRYRVRSIAADHPTCFAHRKCRDAGEKYLEAEDVVIESGERTEGSKMVLFVEALGHPREFLLDVLRLTVTILADEGYQVFGRELVLVLHVRLRDLWVLGSYVGQRSTLRASG